MTKIASNKDIEKVLVKVRHYMSEQELKTITKAWEFCVNAHAGQKRKSGEDFALHPLEVAKTLATWEIDSTTVIAGILHDVIEDTETNDQKLEALFGREVTTMVQGVTKVSDIRLIGHKQEQQVENLRRMILVMAKDIRVVLVRLADRLHNMSTLYALSKNKQVENALETLEIYAPLADRLGMGQVKAELEDLAFPYVYPKEYRELVTKSKKMYAIAASNMEAIKALVQEELKMDAIDATIDIRRKHLYSLWRKLKRSEVDGNLSKIHDLIAARIITNSTEDCYKVLGLIHKIFRPEPGIGVSDYIAQPKPNGYRSIHTKVHGLDGRIFEVQIRTKEMHNDAENGLSAHWHYSHSKAHGAKDSELESGVVVKQNKYAWVQELAQWQNELKNSTDFINAVKLDVFRERIFVFSPKGDAFDLPIGATPVDFAYAVHTGLGKFIKLAKVNGKIVPLSKSLKSGDVIEIVKSQDPKLPNADWLDFALTTRARTEIRKLVGKN